MLHSSEAYRLILRSVGRDDTAIQMNMRDCCILSHNPKIFGINVSMIKASAAVVSFCFGQILISQY